MAQEAQSTQEDTRRLVVVLPDELIYRAKVSAAARRESLRAFVERVLERECAGVEAPTPTAPKKATPTASTRSTPEEVDPAPPSAFLDEMEQRNKKLKEELERREAEEAAKKAQAGR